MAQRITRLTTDQKIAGSNPAEIETFWAPYNNMEKKIYFAPPGGLEPPTFRLTAERANRLRHRDTDTFQFENENQINIFHAIIKKESV